MTQGSKCGDSDGHDCNSDCQAVPTVTVTVALSTSTESSVAAAGTEANTQAPSLRVRVTGCTSTIDRDRNNRRGRRRARDQGPRLDGTHWHRDWRPVSESRDSAGLQPAQSWYRAARAPTPASESAAAAAPGPRVTVPLGCCLWQPGLV